MRYEIEILFIDMEHDTNTPYDSEFVTIEADNEDEALEKAKDLGYSMSNGDCAESLSIEVQL